MRVGLFCYARIVDGRYESTGVPVTSSPSRRRRAACQGIRRGAAGPHRRATGADGATRQTQAGKEVIDERDLRRDPDLRPAERARHSLKVFGDEHYARYENLERLHRRLRRRARAVLLRAPRRGRIPLDRRAAGEPPPAGLARHLQESAAVIEAKAQRAPGGARTAVAGGRDHDEVVRTFGPNQGLLEGRVLSSRRRARG